MQPHLDPAHNVVVDLDLIDKRDLYNKYALLVEQCRNHLSHADDLLDLIDDEFDRDALTDSGRMTLRVCELHFAGSSRLPVTPAIGITLRNADGSALTTLPIEDEA